MYFAGPDTQLITRLEKTGDIQLQGSIIQSSEDQQAHQGGVEVAVAPFIALRASYLVGGDDFSPEREYGRITARHFGLGGFYSLGKNSNWHGASWVGYSEGQVANNNYRVTNVWTPTYERISSQNSYSRWYVEQQFRYIFKGVEVFGLVQLGNTRVFNLSQQGVPNPESEFAKSITWQQQNPQVLYAGAGYGLSAGTKNIRLQARVDSWVGPATRQFGTDLISFYSIGLSWRLETSKLWQR